MHETQRGIMRKLYVSIEIEGRMREVGIISGDNEYTATFRYSDDYLAQETARPVSLSLPLTDVPYGPAETRSFFEGLLPEGFLRRTVAENNRTDSGDYLSILEMLGAECLGAIQIKGEYFTTVEPEYRELDPEMMFRLASEGATTSADLVVEAHLSLTGASGKIGAYLSRGGKWYLPVGSAPSTHILKQSHIRYDHVVENEQLAMQTAAILGISTPESRILTTGVEQDGNVLFATERYDRTMEGPVGEISGMPCPLRLHQEDFGQALGIAAADKYEKGSGQYMKRMFDLLRRWSASPIEDQMKLWDIIVFHWLIGNTDGHIKNFSLVYDRHLRSVRLAPAYDILSTIVYDTHSRQMAFAIGGELDWDRTDRECFVRACEEIGLNKKIFMKRFDDLCGRFEPALEEAAEMLTGEGFTGVRDLVRRLTEGRFAQRTGAESK